MIYINPTLIRIPQEWKDIAANLKQELLGKTPTDRATFINSKRTETWGHDTLLTALRNVVGNKCWYSEVELTGADPNVDHFRPKGNIKEIDPDTLTKTGVESDGYWWLAFDSDNYRLSSMHSNQRRVDENTNGGKWDYFPVDGPRAAELTNLSIINEVVLPLDPCSATDVALMWFGPDGKPGYRNWRRTPTLHEQRRMKITIWLFHLDKHETATQRVNAIEDVRTSLKHADAIYQIWQQKGGGDSEYEKQLFDNALAQIIRKIAGDQIFAGAKRCAVQIARADYSWIDEYL